MTRVKGLASAAALALLFGGPPWWWGWSTSLTVALRIEFLVAWAALLAFVALYYLRLRSMRSLDIKFYLHDLAHCIRDAYAAACRPSVAATDDDVRFYDFLRLLADRGQEYFRRQKRDSTLGIAIRLAVPAEGRKGVSYRTMVRSGLYWRRRDTSEDIHQSEGAPAFLMTKEGRGLLIYNDLPKAISKGAFKATASESSYPDDVKSLMVAPLNAPGWDDESGTVQMIGCLCITSRKRHAFALSDVDSALFLADMLANSLSTVVQKLKDNKKMPTFRVPRK